MTKKKMKNIHDICSRYGEDSIGEFNSVSFPIVQTSNFSYESYNDFLAIADDEKNSYMYTRGSNPTTKLLELRLAALEGGEQCKVFSSGMAAITATLISLLGAGDHVLSLNTIYGQALSFMDSLEKFGITHTNTKGEKLEDFVDLIQENTKIIYLESPSSQFLELVDLESITTYAKKHNIYTVIDNTWATPIHQAPLDFGVDVSMHSISKYISGNSDVVAGAIIGNADLIDKIFSYGHQNFGATNSPFNSWLTINALRTLPLRLKHQEESVLQVMEFLDSDPRIHKIHHPFYARPSQKALAEKYLTGYSSLLSIEIVEQDFEKLIAFVDALEMFKIGVSWGGFESLILPAYKLNNDAQLKQRNMSKTHVRLYVGTEDPQTLIDDLKAALDKVYGEQ